MVLAAVVVVYLMLGVCKQVASMAQSHAVAGSVQQTLQQNVDEPVPLKRKKKDSNADGQAEGRNSIPSKSSLLPHTNLQGMVSLSLTPQLNSLNITSAASEQQRGQLGQTAAGGHDVAHVPLEAATRQGQGNGVATRVQVIACNSTDQSKRGYVVSAEVDQCAGKSGSVSYATDEYQEYSGTSGSDFEVNLKVLTVLSIRTKLDTLQEILGAHHGVIY